MHSFKNKEYFNITTKNVLFKVCVCFQRKVARWLLLTSQTFLRYNKNKSENLTLWLYQLSVALQGDIPHERYRAVEGEIFMIPCLKNENQDMEVMRSRTGEDREGNVHPSIVCGKMFLAEAKHSGQYTYLTR